MVIHETTWNTGIERWDELIAWVLFHFGID
jgi:hypothetical protein